MGTAKGEELDKYNISMPSGKSTGMMEYQALKAAAAEVALKGPLNCLRFI